MGFFPFIDTPVRTESIGVFLHIVAIVVQCITADCRVPAQQIGLGMTYWFCVERVIEPLPLILWHFINHKLGIVQSFVILVVLCRLEELINRHNFRLFILIEYYFLANSSKALVIAKYSSDKLFSVRSTYLCATEIVIVPVVPLDVYEVLKSLVRPFLWLHIRHLRLNVLRVDMELVHQTIHSDVVVLLLDDVRHVVETIVVGLNLIVL